MGDHFSAVRLYGEPDPVAMVLEFLAELRRRKLLQNWSEQYQRGQRMRVTMDIDLRGVE